MVVGAGASHGVARAAGLLGLLLGAAFAAAVRLAVDRDGDEERAGVVGAGGLDLVAGRRAEPVGGELLEPALVVGAVGLGGGEPGAEHAEHERRWRPRGPAAR